MARTYFDASGNRRYGALEVVTYGAAALGGGAAGYYVSGKRALVGIAAAVLAPLMLVGYYSMRSDDEWQATAPSRFKYYPPATKGLRGARRARRRSRARRAA